MTVHPEPVAHWHDRQMEQIGRAVAKLSAEQQPLAEVIMLFGLHHTAQLKMVIDDQGERMERLEGAVQRLDAGLGVSGVVEARTMEEIDALEARLGAPDGRDAGTLMERITRIEAAGRRRDLFIWSIAAVALVELVMLALTFELRPASVGGELLALLRGATP